MISHIRSILLGILAASAGVAHAASSIVISEPSLVGSLQYLGTAEGFDPATTRAVDWHVTGTWHFTFKQTSGHPVDGSVTFVPNLQFYFNGSHSSDEAYAFDLSWAQQTVYLPAFTGTETIDVAIDGTGRFSNPMPNGSDYLRNLLGTSPIAIYLESWLGEQVISVYGDEDPGVTLASTSVNNFTLTMQAIPEPLESTLLVAGAVLVAASRRRRAS